MTRYRISLLLAVFSLAAFTSRANESSGSTFQGCVNYEPQTVSLVGTISRRTVVNVSDQKEVIWVLRLVRPVCVNPDGDDDINVKRSRVTDVQLVLEPEMFARYRRFVRKKVRATGTLFGQHTSHHFTPVLLDVSEMTSAR